ncbi:hypothetical protein [Hoyosella subflava]|uniref:Uncharacterized protein n=1 Tax=Hoyosella subflava (strain DSM 45089 / JCM 17490 / NBRC 109087 / DQS3-9A1) TaxID=443218 RepID=F6EEP5_HOYSD|nr:hypothetical protein [Hoyosella subflava]AEF40845.1 hypothetical protein AS9A_2398 [Hoyosella subflava DQS3-9A1]
MRWTRPMITGTLLVLAGAVGLAQGDGLVSGIGIAGAIAMVCGLLLIGAGLVQSRGKNPDSSHGGR